jgi:hypothetical protein
MFCSLVSLDVYASLQRRPRVDRLLLSSGSSGRRRADAACVALGLKDVELERLLSRLGHCVAALPSRLTPTT